MIIRIFRTRVKANKVQEFEKFINTKGVPNLKKQTGCVASYAGRHDKKSTDFVVVSVWKDLDSLKKFTGASWQKPRLDPEEAALIDDLAEVEHYSAVSK